MAMGSEPLQSPGEWLCHHSVCCEWNLFGYMVDGEKGFGVESRYHPPCTGGNRAGLKRLMKGRTYQGNPRCGFVDGGPHP